uniref:Uncharacterized protein n=1 Tax=Arundo donax TaxID=35708 RepID=A0A0A9ANA0_ARUDO
MSLSLYPVSSSAASLHLGYTIQAPRMISELGPQRNCPLTISLTQLHHSSNTRSSGCGDSS